MNERVLITFGPAVLAYVQLTVLVAASLLPDLTQARWAVRLGKIRRPLTYTTVATAVVHVLCLWHVWYGWDVALPFKNGPAMPIYFHTALALLLVAGYKARAPRSHGSLYLAWILLVFGTTPAPFIHDDYLGGLMVPMVTLTATGVGVVLAWLRWRFGSRGVAQAEGVGG